MIRQANNQAKRLVLLALIMLLLASPRSVSAHATLVHSTPAANAVLSSSPPEIRLWFSERLEPDFSSIDVLDARGQRVDSAGATLDPADATSMSLKLSVLPDGIYTVAWHNVSRDDGHPLSGNFSFTIGQEYAVPASPIDQSDPPPETGRVLGQWLMLAAITLLSGTFGFRLFVWGPSQPAKYPDITRRFGQLLETGMLLLWVALVAGIVQQITQIAGAQSPITSDLIGRVLNSRFGWLWLARVAFAFMLLVLIVRAARPRLSVRAALLGLLTCAYFWLTISLLSHSSSINPPGPSMVADWLHLAATGLWAGGLVVFAVVLWTLRNESDSGPLRADLTLNFSSMARAAVITLLITGSYSGLNQVGTLDALFGTRYGQALVVKLVLIIPLLLIGAVNLLFTEPRLAHSAGTNAVWADRLRQLVRAEAILTVLIMAAVGYLTSAIPAHSVSQARQAAIQPIPFADMRMDNQLHVLLSAIPNQVGPNTFSVGLYDLATNDPINDATLVRLQFTSKDTAIGKSLLTASFKGGGQYQAVGSNLSLPGSWQIRVGIRRPNQYDTVLDFTLNVAPAPQSNDALPQRAVLILLGVIGALSGLLLLVAARRRWLTGGGLLATGLLLWGLLLLGSALTGLS